VKYSPHIFTLMQNILALRTKFGISVILNKMYLLCLSRMRDDEKTQMQEKWVNEHHIKVECITFSCSIKQIVTLKC
jgi:hypothetical protein